MKKRWALLAFAALLLAMPLVQAQAHGQGSFFSVDTGVLLLQIAGAILALASFLVLPFKDRLTNTGKQIIFWALVLPTIIASLYFGASIIHKNVISATEGPVHWHADYQVWVCGERIDLVDPNFPSNKIGEPLFHEHDDDRIHVEGTVLALENVNFGSYFEVIGGELTENHLEYRGKNRTVDVTTGETCPNGQEGNLKVYVNGDRIEDPQEYLPYPDPYVPPGDCIIVEFSPGNSTTTDKLCSSWETQGWNYENYEEKRDDQSLGGYEWQ